MVQSVSDKVLTSIGLMSGTSLDGVDVALLKTDGQAIIEHGPAISVPYSRDVKIHVQRAIKAALEGREGADEIAKATDFVTTAYIDAVRHFMERHKLSKQEIDIIGLHGQTILHRPPLDAVSIGRSWQIGSGAIMAEELGIDVVCNFRQEDMKAGGEGAPLAPVYHAALVGREDVSEPVCIVNIGGVANISWVPPGGNLADMMAFDCGPGNGLIDEWIALKTGETMDVDGAFAAAGTVDEECVSLMCLNPFLRRQPPKSLDRYDFKLDAVKKMGVEDGAATLTAFTAAAIAKSASFLPAAPEGWVIVGGGRHNPVLLEQLKQRLAEPVKTAEEVGWRGDDLEAECFAYLAVRALKKLPLSFPGTTRVRHPVSGGTYHRAPYQ
ncbi:MAG: anhydro-N-acetylmuramic acid kinase [bacterium]